EQMQQRAKRPRRPEITPQFETDLRLLRRAGGQPLPGHLRAFLEPRFGHNLGDVRVHVDHSAAELAQKANARAFTVGKHIVFAAGEYRPGVEQGRRLIAHELTHVFQQRGGLHSVQREVGPERVATADPQADLPSLEELRAAFKLDAASAPPSILSVAVALLRNALRSTSNAQRLRPLTRSEGETAALVRAIQSGAYTLELASLRGGREKGWKLTQRTRRETFVSRSNSATQQWPAATAGDDTITLPTPPAAEDYPQGTIVAGLESISPGDRVEGAKPTPLIPKTVSEGAVPVRKSSLPTPVPETQTVPTAAPAAKVVAESVEAPAESLKEAAPAADAATAAAQPATSEAPAAEDGAPAAAEPEQAPLDPQKDPEFQQTLGQIKRTRKAQGAHIPSDDKLQHTKDATVLKEEKQREKHDRDKHLTEIDATAKKTESVPFTPEEFKKLLNASIKKIETKLPRNEDDANRFKKERPLEQTKEEVRGQVKKKNDEIAGPLATQVDPEKPPPQAKPFDPKPTADLIEEEVGKRPHNISPAAAAPKPRFDSEISMEKESQSLDDLMSENEITEEQLAESNEPTFVEALGSKKAAQEKAAQAPAQFRAVEQPILDKSQAKAGQKGASKFGAMFKGRDEAFGLVSGKQKLTVNDDKAKQEDFLIKLKGIYESTKTDVEGILDALSNTVDALFTLQVTLAKNLFESQVESQLDDIYGFTTWDDSLFGADTEAIEGVFRREKDRFLATMDRIIDQIAKFIADMLNAAMARIKRGRKEADDLFASLSTEQQRLSTDAMGLFKTQFEMLEDGVREKQQDLADTLAESYKSNVDSLRESFDKIKEDISTGWIGKAVNFIKSVAETIKKLGELLLSILSRIGAIIGDILAHPIRFIENLAKGVGDGFDMFIERLDDYLIAGFFDWIRGTVGGPGIDIPDKFDAAGIFSLVAQVAGLSYDTFRKVASKVWGKAAVEFIDQGKAVAEKGLEIFFIVKEKGLGGLWEHIQEHLGSMVDDLMTKVKETVLYEVIKKALAYIAGLFNPVGAFIKAAQAIYAGIRFLMDNIQRIADIVDAFLDSLELAVAGKTDLISQKIVTALRGVIVIAIDFLAKLLGLGDLDEKVRKILKVIRTPVERAMEVVLKALRPLVQKVMRTLGVGKDEEEAEKEVEKKGGEPQTHDEVLDHVVGLMAQETKADTPALALEEKKEQAQNLIKKYQPLLKHGQLQILINDKNSEDVVEDSAVDFDVSASPGRKGQALVPIKVVDERAVQERFSHARSLKKFTDEKGFGLDDWAGTFSHLSHSTHLADMRYGLDSKVKLLTKQGDTYHFKADVKDAEVVRLGALELQNEGRHHAPLQKGRFGVPLIQTFLSGRKIAGIPPNIFDDRAVVSKVAAAAEGAGAIVKVGKTDTWALPGIQPQRLLPDNWRGSDNIRPRFYYKEAGFADLADELFEKVIKDEIVDLIEAQLENIEDARKLGLPPSQADMKPWETMKKREYADTNEKFSVGLARIDGYYQRNRYDVDHVTSLAKHWNNKGHDDGQTERIAATQGKRGGLALMEKGLNRSKGSGGINYQDWVGPKFTSLEHGADDHHVAAGEPFE
ncbi:MAG TPA: DUF4157 domain-containing protein, partial [Pyrinomonadaceae bacterium]